jgi:hypothetical protein
MNGAHVRNSRDRRHVTQNRVATLNIDLFHDTDAAVIASWDADRRLLEAHGLRVRVVPS